MPPTYLDPESSHIHILKPKCVEVDVHMGHNPAPAVQEVAEVWKILWQKFSRNLFSEP